MYGCSISSSLCRYRESLAPLKEIKSEVEQLQMMLVNVRASVTMLQLYLFPFLSLC